jgi:hypothetical protein
VSTATENLALRSTQHKVILAADRLVDVHGVHGEYGVLIRQIEAVSRQWKFDRNTRIRSGVAISTHARK